MRADDDQLKPFPESLCHRCQAARLIRTATSTFIRCSSLIEKYPRQPVMRCAQFKAKTTSAIDAD